MGVGSTDVFLPQQPHASWSVGVTTASWYSPLGNPPTLTTAEVTAGKYYIWDEDAHQADTASPKTVGWAITT